jgi:hypothetical protein
MTLNPYKKGLKVSLESTLTKKGGGVGVGLRKAGPMPCRHNEEGCLAPLAGGSQAQPAPAVLIGR